MKTTTQFKSEFFKGKMIKKTYLRSIFGFVNQTCGKYFLCAAGLIPPSRVFLHFRANKMKKWTASTVYCAIYSTDSTSVVFYLKLKFHIENLNPSIISVSFLV